MHKLKLSIIWLVLSVALISCTHDYKTSVLGVWEADQATKRVGSDDELLHYNYLEIADTHIKGKYFVLESGGDHATQKRFSNDIKDMKYDWKTDKQMLIDDVLYEIELRNDEMTLKNENVEIHYNKQK